MEQKIDITDYELNKKIILNDINKSKSSLKLYQLCKSKFGGDWNETIQLEKEWFNLCVVALINLKKERNNYGL